MITEMDALTTRFVSVPRDLGQLNCAAFGAGVIRGALVSSGFVRDGFALALRPHARRR